MKNVESKFEVSDGRFAMTLTGDVEGDGPTDMQALQIIDHVLSSLPGTNANDGKGNSRKDAIMGKWKSFRELTA